MTHHSNHHGTVIGTVGGTLLTLITNIDTGDILKTAVLSCVGAVVSFAVSVGLKWVVKRWTSGTPPSAP